jgi:hypothetical protein
MDEEVMPLSQKFLVRVFIKISVILEVKEEKRSSSRLKKNEKNPDEHKNEKNPMNTKKKNVII